MTSGRSAAWRCSWRRAILPGRPAPSPTLSKCSRSLRFFLGEASKWRLRSALFLKVYESEGPPPMDPSTMDAELHAMLLACFERDPAARPSATELRTAQTFMRGGAQ